MKNLPRFILFTQKSVAEDTETEDARRTTEADDTEPEKRSPVPARQAAEDSATVLHPKEKFPASLQGKAGVCALTLL